GLIYGRTAYGLAEVLNIGTDEAERLIADYFHQFPAVKRFIERVHVDVTRDGYVDDLFGRRRYLPDATLKPPRTSSRAMTVEAKEVVRRISVAKRQAQNFVIQGASATITKLAMLRCHEHVRGEYGDAVRMILTLHD